MLPIDEHANILAAISRLRGHETASMVADTSDPQTQPNGSKANDGAKRLTEYRQFSQVPHELILPFGNNLAYSADNAGNVTGIKLAGVAEHGAEILNLLLTIKTLTRLVFYSPRPINLPDEIADKDFEALWLGGMIITIPERLFLKGMPLHAAATNQELMLGSLPNEVAAMILTSTQESVRPHQSIEDYLVNAIDYPSSAILLRELKGLFISSPDVSDPPFEIISRGQASIERYFAERGADSLPLNELKIILVGNGGAGKTSLVKKLIGDRFNAKEKQTHGINITKWTIKTESEPIYLNAWDFGGQEIMHATHQFFLSKRSIYILVLDGRKDEDPEYWLQHIESFGGDSPIFVVLNKIDDNPSFDVNRRFLIGKYKSIVDFFRVSCSKGTGTTELSDRLKFELPMMSMLQTRWPSSWFSVKRQLQSSRTPFISLSAYRALCGRHGVNDPESQSVLVGFLHDLGIVLHFPDVHLLDTHVLDPKWVTEGVYRIINSPLLAQNKGVLPMDMLGVALKKPAKQLYDYPPEKHGFLIDLMLKFELCYKLQDGSILVPDLLDIQEPVIAGFDSESLEFVFEYGYLPRSVMPRFIVRFHADIKDQKRWRTGVLLQEHSFQAIALVRVDEKAKRILVSVAGDQKRDFFSTIRKVVNDINASFEKLTVTEYVPLPGHSDILVEYQDLLGHERAGREELFVGRIGAGYNVQKLLNGVEAPSDRKHQTIINVEGDYFGGTVMNVDKSSIQPEENLQMRHEVATWEKVVVYIVGAGLIGLVAYLLVRNEPIADPNLVVAMRGLLSLAVAAVGGAIPGFLRVDYSARGLAIRAGGALALFALAYLATPHVLLTLPA